MNRYNGGLMSVKTYLGSNVGLNCFRFGTVNRYNGGLAHVKWTLVIMDVSLKL